MSSYDVAKLEAALGMHSLKPIDPEAKRVKIKRVTRHKGFNSRTLVSFVLFLFYLRISLVLQVLTKN